MELCDQIKKRIQKTGAISFHDYMEECLYNAQLGYYTSGNNPIGRNGDFYTSPTLTPAFGATIAKQLEEMWHYLGKTAFMVVEYGAGTGALCKSILGALKSNRPMYDDLRYYIIEKSSLMRQLEKEHLTEKVIWCDSVDQIPEINGCILSNELVDNFAVQRVVMKEELKEVFVGYEDGFTEELRTANAALKNYFSELDVDLPYNYHTEVNLESLTWISEIAATLNRGYLMTIDYGFSNLYQFYRRYGTLMCYHKHRVNDCPYHHIGQQDITSHVNFSALSHWGAKAGLKTCGLTNQCQFLMSLGLRAQLIDTSSPEEDVISAVQKINRISRILLMEMGDKYKVLIQEKGMNGEKLSGLSVVLPGA
ncbi:SAM-dependent methyltransferase [Pedobacter steynii]|nr:SAM-dependent methyltransferase [Pedobacter steynii]